MLDDGSYDALIVDAHRDGDAMTLEITITTGAHKGEVVLVRASGLLRDELDLLAAPATLEVRGGVPSVHFD